MKRNEMNWEAVLKSNYKTRAFWDIYWLKCAQSLISSAKVLEPHVLELWESLRANHRDKQNPVLPDHYQGPYFMLLAYAVENLFKAIIVRSNASKMKREFEATKKFPKLLKGHDLISLAKEAAFPFDDGEEDLLRRLTRNAV